MLNQNLLTFQFLESRGGKLGNKKVTEERGNENNDFLLNMSVAFPPTYTQ